MTAYDKLYDVTVDNYGIVTSAMAHDLGVSNMALVQLARRGRLIHLRRGVYKLARHVPTENDDYAQALAMVGETAYLCGESVLAFLDLAPTNPSCLYVAAKERVRKALPRGVVLKKSPPNHEPVLIQGLPCQRVADAIRSASSTVPRERLVEAAKEAYRKGFLSQKESENLLRELEDAR